MGVLLKLNGGQSWNGRFSKLIFVPKCSHFGLLCSVILADLCTAILAEQFGSHADI
jgi:hypothetical protein